jgi:nitrogen regulatory protein P-II 1
MRLLVCIITEPRKVDEILQAFLEIGVTGATVVDSYGMGSLLVEDIPIFAGFRGLLSASGKYNKTIFSVIKETETVERAVAAIEEVCGDLQTPSTGIVFTVPVDFVQGLQPELGL